MRKVRTNAVRHCTLFSCRTSLGVLASRDAAVLACSLLVAGCFGPTTKDETSSNQIAAGLGAIDVPAADSDRCPSFPPQMPRDASEITQSDEQRVPRQAQETVQADAHTSEKDIETLRKQIEETRKWLEQYGKDEERHRKFLEDLRRWHEELERRQGRIEFLPQWPGTLPPEVWIDDKSPNGNPPQWLPNIVGKVLKVTGGGGVEISLGSDNGLQQGCHVDVFRTVDGKLIYVGRLQVTEVTHERAFGKILPAFRKTEIQAGDGVATLRR